MNATQGSKVHLHQTEHPADCPPRIIFPVNTMAWFGGVVSTPRTSFRKTAQHLIQFCRLVALLLALPGVAQAQFTFATNADNTLTITGYTGSNGEVRVPGSIAGLPVISIGDWAFYAASVTNVLIPDTVTNIGDGAFFDCQSLNNVTLGTSVASLGDWAFGFCPGLTSVNCRGNAPSLGGGNVFYGNAATVYYLPGATGWGALLAGHPALQWNSPPVPFNYTTNNGTITISRYTGFGGAVTIPSTINFLPVNIIGSLAFQYNFVTSITIPSSVTSIGDMAFEYSWLLNSLTITYGVANIGNLAFAGCSSMTNVIISETVTNIGENAFSGCGLISVTIPESVVSIGDYSFSYCHDLADVTISEGVSNIGNNTFFACTGLSSVTIPDSIANIGSQAFFDCGLTNVQIGKNVSNIGDNAFLYCFNLAAIAVNEQNPNYSSANGVLFNKNKSLLIQYPLGKTSNYTMPDSVTNISDDAFTGSAITSIIIDDNVTSIGAICFDCESLTNVLIPNSVTNIGASAFLSCFSLNKVTIGSGVTDIGSGAFSNCKNLKGVYFQGNPPNVGVGSEIFTGDDSLTVYYLPGNTSWGATFDGVPTTLWLPQMQSNSGNFGAISNQFGFDVSWASGQSVVVEASTNLLNWQPVQTNTLTTGSAYFSDSQRTNYPGRFYRLRSP